MLLARLRREYTADVARTVLIPLLTKRSPVSLRVLDWTVVNWSKKHNVVCVSPHTGESVNISQAYANTLGFWKRRLFDPFRRRQRIVLRADDGEYETTLGQANFALFLHVTGIYAYVLQNVDAIEDDMNRSSLRHKRERGDALRRGAPVKRCGLVRDPGAKGVVYLQPCHVHFS